MNEHKGHLQQNGREVGYRVPSGCSAAAAGLEYIAAPAPQQVKGQMGATAEATPPSASWAYEAQEHSCRQLATGSCGAVQKYSILSAAQVLEVQCGLYLCTAYACARQKTRGLQPCRVLTASGT